MKFVFLSFLVVGYGLPSSLTLREEKKTKEKQTECLSISLFRFCWRNETKAKKKKRAAQPIKRDCFSCWVSLLWVKGGSSRHCSATKETSPNKKKSNWVWLSGAESISWMSEGTQQRGKAALEWNQFIDGRERAPLPPSLWSEWTPHQGRKPAAASPLSSISLLLARWSAIKKREKSWSGRGESIKQIKSNSNQPPKLAAVDGFDCFVCCVSRPFSNSINHHSSWRWMKSEMIDWSCLGVIDKMKVYYNSTCFIDHIFLKGYHPSINQHLITVIITLYSFTN